MSSATRQTFYRVMTKEFCMMEGPERGGVHGGLWENRHLLGALW